MEEDKKTKKKASSISCPVCGATVRSSEMENHFEMEKLRLDKITRPQENENSKTTDSSSSSVLAPDSEGSTSKNGETSTNTTEEPSPWSTFQKIKNNRNSRLKIKNRKRKADETVVCPVCNIKKSPEDIASHVEICLRRSENNEVNDSQSSEDEIDVEGEIYEWAGQTRIRASSLLVGGHSGAGIGTLISKVSNDDNDDDVIVDGDDLQTYGPPQYSERDILLQNNEAESSYLRNLVIGDFASTSGTSPAKISKPNTPVQSTANATKEENNQNIANNIPSYSSSEEEEKTDIGVSPINLVDDNGEVSRSREIIEALKAKIREYEKYVKNKPRCLICLEDYVNKNPVVSISCWHVYCENCWLLTLGAKKVCPQCSSITSATDLRRIYL